MQIELHVNGKTLTFDVTPQTTLLQSLRESGCYSVKRGCDTGDCGACAVLLDGKLVNSCALLAVQAAGKHILTTEGLGEAADQGWKTTPGLHPLQEAFAQEGAIQCGYCTPAMLMAAKELLDRKGYGGPHPLPLDPAEVREALAGVLCRCSGYVKPVAAVMRAAGRMRGEAARVETDPANGHSIGRRQVKVDAAKLAQGKPAFTLDVPLEGMLVGKMLHSPLAHAHIKRIDASRARALPGVVAVLTYRDDLTPFDKGAYASSTTYISGGAVVRAAEQVAAQIREVAACLIAPDGSLQPEVLKLSGDRVCAPSGRSVTLAEVALDSLHHQNQHQIMAVASFVSPVAPPPFAAQFAEVTVDAETGEVRVDRQLTALDSGVIVNPDLASGQVEGGMIQALFSPPRRCRT